MVKKKIYLGLVGLIGLISAAIATYRYYQAPKLISPLNEWAHSEFIRRFIPASKQQPEKIVYGFLPYWNLDQVQLAPQLTHLAYFGLTLSADGRIMTESPAGNTEPGFQKLKSEDLLALNQTIKKRDGEFELVLALFDNDEIAELVGSEESQQNLLKSLDSLILAYPIDGINLDLEYSGTADQTLRNQFTQLVIKIRQHLDKHYPQVDLSLDLYAAAANKQFIWDLPKLTPHLDYIIVMAYDFHRPNSPQAGPVAPLFGGEVNWEGDINQHLAQFTQVVPKEKLILGLPFYGYQWQTTAREPQAKTYPNTGETVEVNEIEALLTPEAQKRLKVEQHWNQAALSPYLTYEKNGKTFVVYYENSRSISYKIDYVKQLDLAGIAIWALGYEDNQGKLWSIIEKNLK